MASSMAGDEHLILAWGNLSVLGDGGQAIVHRRGGNDRIATASAFSLRAHA